MLGFPLELCKNSISKNQTILYLCFKNQKICYIKPYFKTVFGTGKINKNFLIILSKSEKWTKVTVHSSRLPGQEKILTIAMFCKSESSTRILCKACTASHQFLDPGQGSGYSCIHPYKGYDQLEHLVCLPFNYQYQTFISMTKSPNLTLNYQTIEPIL